LLARHDPLSAHTALEPPLRLDIDPALALCQALLALGLGALALCVQLRELLFACHDPPLPFTECFGPLCQGTLELCETGFLLGLLSRGRGLPRTEIPFALL
jgi:hypothetical protein